MKKLLFLILPLFFTITCLGQTRDSLTHYIDLCGCDALTQAENDSIQNHKGQEELVFYFSNGKRKYREFWKKETCYTICYYPTGNECSERIMDFKHKKEKEISIDVHGNKWWVCKGQMKF
jgi:hypothetical protein